MRNRLSSKPPGGCRSGCCGFAGCWTRPSTPRQLRLGGVVSDTATVAPDPVAGMQWKTLRHPGRLTGIVPEARLCGASLTRSMATSRADYQAKSESPHAKIAFVLTVHAARPSRRDTSTKQARSRCQRSAIRPRSGVRTHSLAAPGTPSEGALCPKWWKCVLGPSRGSGSARTRASVTSGANDCCNAYRSSAGLPAMEHNELQFTRKLFGRHGRRQHPPRGYRRLRLSDAPESPADRRSAQAGSIQAYQ